MLCRRSASLTRTTRTSLTIASSILRTFSAWRASGASHIQPADFGDAFHEARDVRAETLFNASDGIFGVFDGIVKKRGGERGGVQPHVRENVGDFEKMGNIEIAGAAELVAMPLGSNFVSAADDPGIFGRTVFAKFFEELFEAGFEMADGAVVAGSSTEHCWATAYPSIARNRASAAEPAAWRGARQGETPKMDEGRLRRPSFRASIANSAD